MTTKEMYTKVHRIFIHNSPGQKTTQMFTIAAIMTYPYNGMLLRNNVTSYLSATTWKDLKTCVLSTQSQRAEDVESNSSIHMKFQSKQNPCISIEI